jgi:isopentenyl-diphosphate delta-isomerase
MATAPKPPISKRKSDHIKVAASGQADFERTTLLEEVHLIHQSLPEMAYDDVDLTTELCGQKLAAPIVISGMTGGTDEAGAINRDLATAAQNAGIAFGVGSQRAMAEHPELSKTFEVRDVAPDVFLIGNLGVVQARSMGTDAVAELAKRIGADAMAIHLNPAQELIQKDGDRDFSGSLDTIARLVAEMPVPVIVKETGCGLSPTVATRLKRVGVSTVDVSGAGGTSWVAVEAKRAAAGSPEEQLGQELWNWGTPTAVSAAVCAKAGLEVIATGGLRTGSDIAAAMALGAAAGGLAAGALRAQQDGGCEGVESFLARLRRSLTTICLLTGSEAVTELRRRKRHLGPNLRSWLQDLGALL